MSLDGTMMYREKRQEGAATMTQNAKIGQHFVWVMVERCGEKSPHKPPMKGGAHDAQGLLLRRVGKSDCLEKEGLVSKTACRIRIHSPRECEVALFLHNGAAAPVEERICPCLVHHGSWILNRFAISAFYSASTRGMCGVK